MMWKSSLKFDPFSPLLGSDSEALHCFIERDLLGSQSKPVEFLWKLPKPLKILEKQQINGAWHYPGSRPGADFGEAYELLETWKILRALVEMYGFTRQHPAVERACEYILSYQTEEGDLRGILSNQYAPYYTGAMLEILIKTGYEQDGRILRGLNWLLEMRQDDGGWIIPLMMFKINAYYRLYDQPPVPPDRQRPFSHMATGMVTRAFAAHPDYRLLPEIVHAGNLLKGRFFQKDAYTSRQSAAYWFKFQYPFWWTDLLTVMDSLMRIGNKQTDEHVEKALDWFIENQATDGLWHAAYGGASRGESNEWVTLAVCRVLKHFIGE